MTSTDEILKALDEAVDSLRREGPASELHAEVLRSHRARLERERRGLTFRDVSETNLARALVWHPKGLAEWTVADWAVAMAGEAGEVCNAVKKLRRIESAIVQAKGPGTTEKATTEIANEIGDTFLYLDLLAQRLGICLEGAVRDTFNRVSIREGFEHRLHRALVSEPGEKEKRDGTT